MNHSSVIRTGRAVRRRTARARTNHPQGDRGTPVGSRLGTGRSSARQRGGSAHDPCRKQLACLPNVPSFGAAVSPVRAKVYTPGKRVTRLRATRRHSWCGLACPRGGGRSVCGAHGRHRRRRAPARAHPREPIPGRARWDPRWMLENVMGPNPVWLAEAIAPALALRPGNACPRPRLRQARSRRSSSPPSSAWP